MTLAELGGPSSTTIVIDNEDHLAPEGLTVRNFRDPEVFRFKNANRYPPACDAVVVHETVTTSWKETVDVLKARGLGVHFIVDEKGTVFQHADLMLDLMWHATQFNRTSVGIEVVNPFEERFRPKTVDPWPESIEAPWTGPLIKRYVLPTRAQAEAVVQLVDWLTSAAANPVAIPQHWPGLQGGRTMAMGRVKADAISNPGVHAHMYFGHADGAWLVLYAWLRLEAGLGVVEAYDAAKELATGAGSQGVDLSKYFDANPYLEA